MKHKFSINIVMIAALMISFSCKGNKTTYASQKPVSSIDEAARFLAGGTLPEESPLHAYTQKKHYKAFAKQIRAGWNKFQGPNHEKIKKWWEKYKPSKYDKTILYPFSGPDIMNAVTFFPEGETYIMFGLEPPGAIPSPQKMTEAQINKGLIGLRRSLGTILHMNFFRTKGMAVNLANKSFNGITGLIMFFLSVNGYTVVDAKKIVIDAASNVAEGRPSDDKINWKLPPKSRVPGVEISFKGSGRKIKKIRYYMLNVIDHALATSSPNFLPYLKKEGPFTTIIKSASYLMHNDKTKFTKIRKAILSSTNFFVQDDSGIPLRYFTADKWTVNFHGVYDAPIGLFRHRLQKDLLKAYKKKSTGVLPFSYGYDYIKGQSNLMTVERKK